MRRDLYQEVTDRILAALDAGTVPWRKPWTSRLGGGGMPRNLKSGKDYRGVNVWLLHVSGFGSRFWCTYRQAKEMGAQVRKGERGSTVIFWKILEKAEKGADGKVRKVKVPMMRHYTVFNAEQVDGLEERIAKVTGAQLPEPVEFEPIAAAAAVAAGYPHGPRVVHGGGRACYMPGVDVVQMPRPEDFAQREEYYSTLFHELGHSTGHESRLKREFGASFGDHAYTREELIAEMTAAYLCNHAGIETAATFGNSAAYLAGWRQKLKADPKAVVIAAQAAQKAADLILDEAPAVAVAS